MGDFKQQYKNNRVVKAFNKLSDSVKKTIKYKNSEKYNKFVNKIMNNSNKKLIKLIPIVLLSLTILAIKNKRIIQPIFDAYKYSLQNTGATDSFSKKSIAIINEYIKILKKMNILDSLEIGIFTLVFFVEEIPSLFTRMNSGLGINQLAIYKNIIKNVNEVKKELIDKPDEKKQLQKEKQEERKEIRALKEELQVFRKSMKDGTSTKRSHYTDIQTRKVARPSLRRKTSH